MTETINKISSEELEIVQSRTRKTTITKTELLERKAKIEELLKKFE